MPTYVSSFSSQDCVLWTKSKFHSNNVTAFNKQFYLVLYEIKLIYKYNV